MSQIARGAKNTKTFTFPNTAYKVLDDAFRHAALRSVRPNEDLEDLGNRCFSSSCIKEFRAPRELQEIGKMAFSCCERLNKVALNEGLETLVAEEGYYDEENNFIDYTGIFGKSGLEEIELPGTLTELFGFVFKDSRHLRLVWVGDGCTADVRKSVESSVVILRAQTMVGDRLLRDLRALKDVTIPDGVDEVGDHWFSFSGVERVIVPGSVRKIGAQAFMD